MYTKQTWNRRLKLTTSHSHAVKMGKEGTQHWRLENTIKNMLKNRFFIFIFVNIYKKKHKMADYGVKTGSQK